MFPAILVSLCVLGMVVLGVAKYRASQPGKGKDGPVHHFRCPHCRRKLGFRQRQVGRQGKCGRCRGNFVFPPPAQALD